ncbi:MAG: hypothetical protein WC477_06295 [Patescibacteria group bacterium]
MHTIQTKENWTSDPDSAPLPSDFIRIESNTRKVEENRQEETALREAADESEVTARNLAISDAINDIPYKGSNISNLDYPINTYIFIENNAAVDLNVTLGPIGIFGTSQFALASAGASPPYLNGTWKSRGWVQGINKTILAQRVE